MFPALPRALVLPVLSAGAEGRLLSQADPLLPVACPIGKWREMVRHVLLPERKEPPDQPVVTKQLAELR